MKGHPWDRGEVMQGRLEQGLWQLPGLDRAGTFPAPRASLSRSRDPCPTSCHPPLTLYPAPSPRTSLGMRLSQQ